MKLIVNCSKFSQIFKRYTNRNKKFEKMFLRSPYINIVFSLFDDSSRKHWKNACNSSEFFDLLLLFSFSLFLSPSLCRSFFTVLRIFMVCWWLYRLMMCWSASSWNFPDTWRDSPPYFSTLLNLPCSSLCLLKH